MQLIVQLTINEDSMLHQTTYEFRLINLTESDIIRGIQSTEFKPYFTVIGDL